MSENLKQAIQATLDRLHESELAGFRSACQPQTMQEAYQHGISDAVHYVQIALDRWEKDT